MTTKQPYPEEFKIEAVKQITERGHRVADVSDLVGSVELPVGVPHALNVGLQTLVTLGAC